MAFGVKNIKRKQKEPEKRKTKPLTSARKTGLLQKLKNKIKEYIRVLRITKKPTAKEFKMIVKVTSLGIAVIGAIGFIIWFIITLFE